MYLSLCNIFAEEFYDFATKFRTHESELNASRMT